MVVELETKMHDKSKCIFLCIGWATNARKGVRSCWFYQECSEFKELMKLNGSLIMLDFPLINLVRAHARW